MCMLALMRVVDYICMLALRGATADFMLGCDFPCVTANIIAGPAASVISHTASLYKAHG